MYDPELYRDRGEVEQWKHRDPLILLEGVLREAGELDDDQIARFEADVSAEIEAAVAAAEAADWEPVEDLTRFVYSEVAR
jgi:TPP-dependent pyruvate/acetoin dehydrogenase alpha subunit